MIKVIYYIASILSIIFFVISVQYKEKKHILLIQSLSSLSYIVTYGIAGAWSGVATEVIEAIKDLVFYKYEDDNKNIPLLLLIFFVLSLIVANAFTVKDIFGLIPLLINLDYLTVVNH